MKIKIKKGYVFAACFLAALFVALAAMYPVVHVTDAPSGYLQIVGNVPASLNITVSQLEAMPSTTITAKLVSSGDPSENGVYNYTGVTLWSVLRYANVSSTASYVTIIASDSYQAVVTIKEAENNPRIILAYMQNGQYIKSRVDGGDGPLHLICGNDTYAQRWVKWVVELDVT